MTTPNALQDPQVGIEPIGDRPRQQRLLDLGQLSIRHHLGSGPVGPDCARRPPHTPLKAGVPDVGTLAGHAELVGDLALGAALGLTAG